MHVRQILAPVALRLVEQSPVLQPGLQVRVWVKDCPEQTVLAAGDQGSLPQTTGQSWVLQAWLSVSVADPRQVPPHASVAALPRVLLRLCVPPPQLALQALQPPHGDQAPHTQLLGGFAPEALRLVEQPPVLQPGLHVRV